MICLVNKTNQQNLFGNIKRKYRSADIWGCVKLFYHQQDLKLTDHAKTRKIKMGH